MKRPFTTPIRVADETYLVAEDAELICNTESATRAELAYIVHAVNNHERLLLALRNLRSYVDVSTIRPGKRVEANWSSLCELADLAIGEASL